MQRQHRHRVSTCTRTIPYPHVTLLQLQIAKNNPWEPVPERTLKKNPPSFGIHPVPWLCTCLSTLYPGTQVLNKRGTSCRENKTYKESWISQEANALLQRHLTSALASAQLWANLRPFLLPLMVHVMLSRASSLSSENWSRRLKGMRNSMKT